MIVCCSRLLYTSSVSSVKTTQIHRSTVVIHDGFFQQGQPCERFACVESLSSNTVLTRGFAGWLTDIPKPQEALLTVDFLNDHFISPAVTGVIVSLKSFQKLKRQQKSCFYEDPSPCDKTIGEKATSGADRGGDETVVPWRWDPKCIKGRWMEHTFRVFQRLQVEQGLNHTSPSKRRQINLMVLKRNFSLTRGFFGH